MIERVVVPVDFTPGSDRALMMAPTLARWAGARVELITVAGARQQGRRRAEAPKVGRRFGEATTCRIVESGGPIEAVLLASCIAARKSCGASDHTPGSFGEMLRDSLSEELVREAHVPSCSSAPTPSAAPSGHRAGSRARRHGAERGNPPRRGRPG